MAGGARRGWALGVCKAGFWVGSFYYSRFRRASGKQSQSFVTFRQIISFHLAAPSRPSRSQHGKVSSEFAERSNSYQAVAGSAEQVWFEQNSFPIGRAGCLLWGDPQRG